MTSPSPSPDAVAVWTGLMRAHRVASSFVEAALKQAGLPALEWYDVLLELERGGGLRPRDLQARLLFAQYNLSRLLDRMTAAGVVRKEACPDDRRGHLVVATPEGLALRRRMWSVYGPAIEAAVAPRLDAGARAELAALLRRLSRPDPGGVREGGP